MNSQERDLAESLLERLQDVGIEVHNLQWSDSPDGWYDATVLLSRRSNLQNYRVVFSTSMTFSRNWNLRHLDSHAHILVVGERITERSATSLRDFRVQYIDSLGNAYIEFGDVYIDIRGRRPSVRAADQRPALFTTARFATEPRSAHNIFSPRRSQVVLALLTWPHLATMTVRDLATAAGVSIGQAHDTLAMLEEIGYLRRGRPLQPDDARAILRPWALEYPRGLRRKLILGAFHAEDPATFHPLYPDQEIYLSGESAAGVDIQRPTTLTLFLEHFDRKLAFVNRWGNEPNRAPNVTVMRKFWTVPPEQMSHDSLAGPHNAPWPLVYADLLATNDPRLSEVAETWRSNFV